MYQLARDKRHITLQEQCKQTVKRNHSVFKVN